MSTETASTVYDLLILGGGISGLSAAFFAQKQKRNFLILEQDNRLGGSMHTRLIEGQYPTESGASNEIWFGPTLTEICTDLGLEVLDVAQIFYLYSQGKLRRLGPHLWHTFFSTFSWHTKQTLLTGLFRQNQFSPQADPNLITFFQPWFTPQALETVVPFAMGCFFGGPPEQLSAKATFPRLWQALHQGQGLVSGLRHVFNQTKQDSHPYADLYSFPKGLRTLIKAVQETLPAAAIRCNSTILSLKQTGDQWQVHLKDGQILRAKTIVMALPAQQAARVYPTHLADLGTFTCYRKIIIVNTWLKDFDSPFETFNFNALNPRPFKLAGTGHYPAQYFPDLAPPGYQSVTCYFNGLEHPDLFACQDEELGQLASADFKQVFACPQARITPKAVTRWPKAYPLYQVGHTALIDRIQKNLPPTLALAGNYLGGGAHIEYCAQSGKQAIAKIHQPHRQERIV